MYVVCKEHLEEAIDAFLEVYEDQAPDIYLLADLYFSEWTAPCTCEFCDKPPKYLVV
ncbi:MAG: CxxH/CxxC protein [Bacillota bacterium]